MVIMLASIHVNAKATYSKCEGHNKRVAPYRKHDRHNQHKLHTANIRDMINIHNIVPCTASIRDTINSGQYC